jgi:hypothetical protein
MIHIIFKNSAIIRTFKHNFITLYLMIKPLLKKIDGVPWQFYRLVRCAVSWKMFQTLFYNVDNWMINEY